MDLSLVPVNELADELMKRGETAIVLVHTSGPDRQQYHNWVGEYHAALGLTVDMQRVIIGEAHDGDE